MKKILYAKPSITELEIEYVNDAIRHGWGERCYDYIIRLRRDFERYLGVKHAFATSSCTGAIHMALSALGVGPGDEVIVPDATWIASVAPIVYLGATPVFVDVHPDTWCIEPTAVEAAITERTKAIIAVYIYGNPVDIDSLLTIAKRHQLALIEDAAEAIGTEINGQKAGSMADFGVFSFHGTKTMTTGEGGMLVCNRDDLAEQIIVLENHGRDPKVPKMFWCEQLGFKYRMSNLQAALGCAQLERIEELVCSKRQVFRWYQEHSSEIPDISWNAEPEGTLNSYWMPTVILGDSYQIERDEVISLLNDEEIHARPFFYPVSSFPMFQEQRDNVHCHRLGQRGINVPNYFDLCEEDVSRVCQALGQILANARQEFVDG